MLVGAVLATVGLFAPWWRVYTGYTDTPGEHVLGAWTLLFQSGFAPWVALGCFLPVATLVASSVASVFLRAPREQTILGTFALVLALGCLAVALLVLALLPEALALGYPFYDILGVEYGAWAAIAGFVCIVAGILGYHF